MSLLLSNLNLEITLPAKSRPVCSIKNPRLRIQDEKRFQEDCLI
jgi:hypothetical protein